MILELIYMMVLLALVCYLYITVANTDGKYTIIEATNSIMTIAYSFIYVNYSFGDKHKIKESIMKIIMFSLFALNALIYFYVIYLRTGSDWFRYLLEGI